MAVVMTPETIFCFGAAVSFYFRIGACNENHGLKINNLFVVCVPAKIDFCRRVRHPEK
jgi:hypothetical protein